MNTNRIIEPSELPVNEDGSIFHLHLKPGQLASTVILVGDRQRVDMVANYFDKGSIECDISNREFHTITGTYKGKRISCLSHGIGAGNIDIVMNEMDALFNIDLETRQEMEEKTQLTIVRIGTCGSLQSYCPVGSYVVSAKSIGFDGLLNYYSMPADTIDLEFEFNLVKALKWNDRLPRPYVVSADEELTSRISDGMIKGVTISAPGFYGPQGRIVRLLPTDPFINKKIEDFSYNGMKITNYEMESAAVAGLAKLLGHKAVTVCNIIAGRVDKNMNTNYHETMETLVKTILDRI